MQTSSKTHRESMQENTAATALVGMTRELISQSFEPFTFREAGKTENYRCASSSASSPSHPSQTLARAARYGTVLSRLRCRGQINWKFGRICTQHIRISKAILFPKAFSKAFSRTQTNFCLLQPQQPFHPSVGLEDYCG